MKNAHLLVVPMLAVCLAAPVFAADAAGPPFGKNAYAAAIATMEGTADVDDYAGSLVAGETLTVAVDASKGSTLQPSLLLVAPDGTAFTPLASLVTKRGGASLQLKSFLVPTTGRWAVRITGAKATQGAYAVAFAVAPARATNLRGASIVGTAGVTQTFQAVDGSLLDVTATWRDAKSPVQFRSLLDPSGHAVAGVVPTVKGRTLSIHGLALHGGDGTYTLVLGTSAASAKYDLAIKATPQGRPSSKKPLALSGYNPCLPPRDAPLVGIPGVTLRMDCLNLDPSAPPTVLFGGRAAGVNVFPDGRSMNVIVPGWSDGTTVDVAVVSRDGQSSVQPAYFHYAEMPVAKYLVNAGGLPARAVTSEGGDALTLHGAGFADGQSVYFGSMKVASAVVSSAMQVDLVVPPHDAGDVPVSIVDPFGRTSIAPFTLTYMSTPRVDAVTAVAGPMKSGSEVAMSGGATVEITGAFFHASDVVTINGAVVPVVSATGGKLVVTAPPGPAGAASIVVTNEIGQQVVVAGAFSYVGFVAADAFASPPSTAVDDLRGLRLAAGDFDSDGNADLVLSSFDVVPGTRGEFTRLFFGGADGLVDDTSSKFPAAGSDPAHVDAWKAKALLLADLVDDGRPEIILAGDPVLGDVDGDFEARLFVDDGTGAFSLSSASPRVNTTSTVCTDSYFGTDYPLLDPSDTNGAAATALAVGDLDGDGRPDVVMATDRFRKATVHLPLDSVTWYDGAASMAYASFYWDPTGVEFNAPALRIFKNTEDAGLVDVTFPRVPLGGTVGDGAALPAFHGRDVKIADVNGDGSMDIVVAWDDPTTVAADDMAAGGGSPQIATRVLINDGSGSFTDQTDTWMPAGSGAEFWQADRIALVPLKGDGTLYMVLLSKRGLDAWQGAATHAASALRILRDSGTGFVDVTMSLLPWAPIAGTADDDLRGDAMIVSDIDGDGAVEIVLGTTDALHDAAGGRVRSTRLLRLRADGTYVVANEFLPAASVDSGEADDLVVADVFGAGVPSLVLATESHPTNSRGGSNLRAFQWRK